MTRYEAMIRRYFDACNAGDYDALVACFTPEAVHYFPPGLPGTPWRGAEAIAKGWVWCVETLGSRWTIERVLVGEAVNADGSPSGVPEAVIEWTHWKTSQGTALRGDEWYRFDPESGLISEIRAYYAAPAQKGVAIDELHGFDYRGRGYHLSPG
ncbi:nuclear transport factor 2 family protein [Roseomonas sp. OT10]|uniref:nuclear transport factor 2 family protein n=1 Tax=Roseomonas cutis TaxID=2897332 RepID=UPI001E3426E9|nr:nuclear transport factor 2 family protein [Roseomonas sp. OT10]UFN48281.1 nuclear transport factor 2 family protein [Roseomonas sp. OT10]